jgi:hypothetical protein
VDWTKRTAREPLVLLLTILALAAGAESQSLSPPIAQYRGKANGMLELRNNGDTPLAALLELRGFSVDRQGTVRYGPLAPGVSVQLGASSFIIPPHQVHYVFYKASVPRLPAWFAIINTLAQAAPVTRGIRINIILPHFAYIYQKSKLHKDDVLVRVLPEDAAGRYALEVQNVSKKLGRAKEVRAKGFRDDLAYGSFPLFPGETRRVSLQGRNPSQRARLRIQFEDGFHVDESLPAGPAGKPVGETAAAHS